MEQLVDGLRVVCEVLCLRLFCQTTLFDERGDEALCLLLDGLRALGHLDPQGFTLLEFLIKVGEVGRHHFDLLTHEVHAS